jgi:ParB-like chromosome segregation protein Spo0J
MCQATLDLSDIRIDGGTQSRAEMNQAVVDDYAADIDSLPPAVIFNDGESNWLADGFYRYHAHKAAKKKDMVCEVRKGTLDDAKWFAAGANKSHGLRRTNEDKANAVKMALSLAGGISKTDRELAEHCGVAPNTVAKYRAELAPIVTAQIEQSDSDEEKPAEKRTGRDGRAQSVSSEKRSTAAKESAAKQKESLREQLHPDIAEAFDGGELTISQIKKLAPMRAMLQVDELKKIRETAAKKNAPNTQVVAGHRSENSVKPPANEKPAGKWAKAHEVIGKLSRTVDSCADASSISTSSPKIKAIHDAINSVKQLILKLERGQK